MPRDSILTNDMYKAVRQVFDCKIGELGQAHRIDYIYQVTALSPAPAFFITYNEARRIVCAHESGRLRGRIRTIIKQRDMDFVQAYNQTLEANPGWLKSHVINEAILAPAPRFYVNGKMVAFIIAKRGKN